MKLAQQSSFIDGAKRKAEPEQYAMFLWCIVDPAMFTSRYME